MCAYMRFFLPGGCLVSPAADVPPALFIDLLLLTDRTLFTERGRSVGGSSGVAEQNGKKDKEV